MGGSRIEKLKAKADLELRRGHLGEALHALGELEAAQPDEPAWPKRQAEIFHRQGRRREELAALLRTSRLEVETDQVLAAIATCKLILSLDENHDETLDRLHLLCMAPGATPSKSGDSADCGGPNPGSEPEIALPGRAVPVREDAPLEEIVLTDVLPEARPASLADLESAGAALIPLDPNESTVPPDLHLDDPRATEVGPGDLQAGTSPTPDPGLSRDELLQSALFGSLGPQALRRLLRDVNVVNLAPGDEFFRQGDPADCLCVVVEGAVVPVAEEAQRARLGVLERGEFFGEIGLLADQPRNATVEALVETRLLTFDRAVVWKLLREHGEILGVLLRAMRERLIDRLVRTSSFFAVFKRAKRSVVARQFRLLEVRENAVVIQQGLSEQGLFVVLAGELDVVAEDVGGDKALGSLQAGDVFGEMSTLYQEPAIASVITRKKCWLLSLSHARFAKILEHNPKLLEMMHRIARERSCENRSLSPP